MQPDPETGTSTRRLTRALRDSGVGVEVRSDLDFNDLTRVIEAGFPVIVEVATGTRRLHHWVVLYGDGVAPARVYLAANGWPWVGRRVFTRREFAQLWRPRGKGLICNG